MIKPISSVLLASFLFIVACQKEKNNVRPIPSPPAAPTADTAVTSAPPVFSVATIANNATMNLKYPKGIAIDAGGNLYISDWGHQQIRKIVSDSVATTLAGSNAAGFVDAAGTTARFHSPHGVAVDGVGNVYIADADNNCIRKISPDGVVTTLAGSSGAGQADGSGTAARFNHPRDVAIDAEGNLYIADTDNHRVRKITPAGVVSTVAGTGKAGFGDGAAAAAQFNGLRGIAVDKGGNLYIADTYNNRIRKISATGVVTTLAGSSTSGLADGSGSTAQFNHPKSLTIDSKGTLYIADTDNQSIRKVTGAGVVTTIAGNGKAGYANGSGPAAQFSTPRGIAIDASGKNLYIVDQDNNRIRKIAVP